MNYEKLREAIDNSGMKHEFIAAQIGVSGKVFHDRINGLSNWRLPEIRQFCKLLNLKKRQRDDIFFADM